MKKALYKIWAKFLTEFGNIRLSKYIPWLYYDTTDPKVKGCNIIDIMKVIQQGDIILRGYDSYADSHWIDDPLSFSHGALYVGNNTIIHAIAEGVSYINLIDFCLCDRIAIFRAKKGQRKAIQIAKSYLGTDYDFSFTFGDNAIYCFELCCLCYSKINFEKCSFTKLGFIKKCTYLAKSFFKCKELKCVYHFNPKFNIDLAIKC